jgi:hypothetical protein
MEAEFTVTMFIGLCAFLYTFPATLPLFKGTLARDFFLLFFFHQKHPLGPQIHTLNSLRIKNRICRDIRIIRHSALTQITWS